MIPSGEAKGTYHTDGMSAGIARSLRRRGHVASDRFTRYSESVLDKLLR
jgi:hypothetical protein